MLLITSKASRVSLTITFEQCRLGLHTACVKPFFAHTSYVKGRMRPTNQTVDVGKVQLLSEVEARVHKPFKLRKTFMDRQNEAYGIRDKFPSKIPVIVERYQKEKNLPSLDKTKFLVPDELTMSQFVTIIRNRMKLSQNQAFYLIVNNKSFASLSTTMLELFRDEKDEDGFLYMVYASQEMFG